MGTTLTSGTSTALTLFGSRPTKRDQAFSTASTASRAVYSSASVLTPTFATLRTVVSAMSGFSAGAGQYS